MAVTAEDLRAQQAAAHAEESEVAEGPLRQIFKSAQRLVHGYALLAVLDVRRATLQLAWLIAAGVIVAVLVVTAWLGLMVALITWLLGEAFSLPLALLIAAGLNIVAAAFLGWRAKLLMTEMPFAATLRQLKGDPPAAP